jgi:hypothetical protein
LQKSQDRFAAKKERTVKTGERRSTKWRAVLRVNPLRLLVGATGIEPVTPPVTNRAAQAESGDFEMA